MNNIARAVCHALYRHIDGDGSYWACTPSAPLLELLLA